MGDGSYRVQQLDHVEFFVPRRREAAQWYRRVLGFEILAEHEAWAEDPRGPLMISSDGGGTKLALFRGEPQGGRPAAGFQRVAFRTDGPGFLQFLDRVGGLSLRDRTRAMVTRDDVKDHERAFSIYFCDPHGHHLEVTTYDHDHVAKALACRKRR